MHEYQITISRDGKFLFRTEWDDDMVRVMESVETLKVLEGVRFYLWKRSKLMERIDITTG